MWLYMCTFQYFFCVCMLCVFVCTSIFIYFLSRLQAQYGVQHGAWSHNPEIKIWAEVKSQTLNWLSHLGTPVFQMILRTAVLGRWWCPYFYTWVHGAQKGQGVCLDKSSGPWFKTIDGWKQPWSPNTYFSSPEW